MNVFLRTTVSVVLCVWATTAVAVCDDELGPVAGLFAIGLPEARPAGFSVCFALANHSTDNSSPLETLLFDGETLRLSVGWRREFGRWDLGVDVPFLSHDDGFLDSTIEGWHDAFGLPNGNRDRRPNDVLAFQWTRDGAALIDRTESASGIGDARLTLGRTLYTGDDWRFGARALAKFATGDADDLTGSGDNDFTLGLTFEHDALLGAENWRLSSAVALTVPGDSDLLGVEVEDQVASARVTVVWQASPAVAVGARVRTRERIVRSELREVGEGATALDAWLGFRLGDKRQLTLGVSEDIRVDSQPDVVFRLAFDFSPGR